MFLNVRKERIDYSIPKPRGLVTDGPTPWADIRYFGADEDIDCTAAIQAAIDSLPAAGGKVYIPAGVWPVSNTIKYIPSAVADDGNSGFVTICGDGPLTSRIRANNLDAPIFQSKNPLVRYHGVTFRDLEIVNSSTGTNDTWVRSGATVTITRTAHGFSNGNVVEVSSSSSTAALPNKHYFISNVQPPNTFDVTGLAAGDASGTCITKKKYGTGLDFERVSRGLIENVRILDCGTGIYSRNQSFWVDVIHPMIQDTGIGIHLDVEGGAGTPANEWNVHGGMTLSTVIGVLLDGTTNNKFYGLSNENFTTAFDVGVTGGTPTNNTQIYSCRMENVPTTGVGVLLNSSQTNFALFNPHFVGLTTNISGTRPARSMIIENGRFYGGLGTFTSNSTTPSVANGNVWVTNNSVGTSITNFLNGTTSMLLTVKFSDSNTTIVSNETSIFLKAPGNNYGDGTAGGGVPSGTVMQFVNISGDWYEVSRSQ